MIEFEVKLKDGVTAPAGSGAHQVDVLTKSMRGLQNQMIKANALGDAEKFNKLAGAHAKLGGRVDALKQSMKGAGEKMGGAAAKTSNLKQEMSAATAELAGVAAGAAVAAGAVVALVGGFAALLHAVGGVAQERRALEASFEALGDRRAVAMLDELSTKLPFTTNEMAKWSRTMMDAGIKDLPRLEQAMKAAAASSAIMGDATGATGEKVVGLLVQMNDAVRLRQGIGDLDQALRGTGVGVDELATKLGVSSRQLRMMAASGRQLPQLGNAIQDALVRKGIKPMREMGMTWAVISKKFHDTATHLMTGVAETPGFKAFMHSLAQMLALFGQNTASGKAMQTGITGAFNVMFGAAARFTTWLTIQFLQMEISALKFYLAMAPIIQRIHKWWDAVDGGLAFNGLLIALKYTMYALAIGTLIVLSPILLLAAAFYGVVFAVMWVIGWIAKSWKSFKEWGTKLVEWFGNLGTNIVTAIADGITGGTKDLGLAMNAAAETAKKIAKGSLEVHSPSKVFMRIGRALPEGMAQGIEQGTPDVANSAQGMAGAAAAGGSSSNGSPAKAGSTYILRVERGAIVIEGAGRDAMSLTEEAVSLLFERWCLSQGLVPG